VFSEAALGRPKNPLLDGSPIPQVEGAVLELSVHCKALRVFAAVYAKTAELIGMLVGGMTHVGPRNHCQIGSVVLV